MIYDLKKESDKADVRYEHLKKKGAVVELTEKTNRSLNQNSYLHLLFGIFAIEYGCSIRFVKDRFFKETVNPDLFVTKRRDKILGDVTELRSSADLSVEEMTTAIDRFKIWSSQTAGIFLPDSFTKEERYELERLMDRNKRYL